MRNTIINIHIPKTAGTTFNFRLNESLKLHGNSGRFKHLYDTRPMELYKKSPILRDMMKDELAKPDHSELTFFSGHYRFRDLINMVEQSGVPVHWVTFLREPVSRALSDYFFSRSDRNNAKERFIERFPSLDVWRTYPKEVGKHMEYLRPADDASVEDTIKVLKERFSFVGLTEHADSDFEVMMNNLGLRPAETMVHNRNPNPDYLRDAMTTYGDDLRELLADDIKIYETFSKPDRQVWTVPDLPQAAPESFGSDEALKDEIRKRAPWNHKIYIRNGIWTGGGTGQDATGQNISLFETHQSFDNLTRNVLPNGLEGRSFLDCGCNGGGYCFAAKDKGASTVTGFDVRDHWIDQANFVLENREAPSDGITFHKGDLLDLSFLDPRYDVTWFSGVFYHLPDPVTALKNVADRTSELLFLNTAVEPLGADETEVPALKMRMEGVDQLMSGIYRLAWYPSGPKVIESILVWLGFPEVRILFWHKQVERPGHVSPGRLSIVAAREPGRLDHVKNAEPRDAVKMPAREPSEV
ncbi:MAG: class I SAM-dependent methyltransferase [Pseudomonadota bacterium]